MKLAARVAVYLAIFAAVLYFIQDSLLYHPGKSPLAEVMAQGSARGLRPWPQADQYRGWLASPAAAARGTVVVFHGNAGNAYHRSHYADALVRRGLRVFLLEYPGYGRRPGPVGEESFARDALDTLERLQREFPGPVYLYGESLGAAVAATVAARSGDRVAGVALITPWDTLAAIARHHYWFLPVAWLVRDRYDTIANLNAWQGPVAVLIAAADEIIPPAHAQRLFDALATRKQRWVFADAGHNDWPAEPDAPWWDEVLAYLESGSG